VAEGKPQIVEVFTAENERLSWKRVVRWVKSRTPRLNFALGETGRSSLWALELDRWVPLWFLSIVRLGCDFGFGFFDSISNSASAVVTECVCEDLNSFFFEHVQPKGMSNEQSGAFHQSRAT